MREVDFAALLEAIPDAVLVADMSSRIVYANDAVEPLLGWKASQLVGESLHVIQPERLHQAHDTGFGRFAATGVQTLFDVPIRLPARRADGTEHDVELNLAEIRGPEDERLVIGVLRDLSERVELERHLTVLRYLRATTAAAARLWTGLDPTLVLRTLTDVLVEEFDAALARTWLFEPDANVLRMVTSGGLSTNVTRSSRALIDVATYPYKVGTVARTREPVMRNGLVGDPEFDQAWVAREGLESVACLPLLAGNRLLGVAVAFFRRPLIDEVMETIGHLIALAAAAVNDAQLVEGERAALAAADRARSHFELLAGVSERLAGSLDPEVTARSVAEATVPSVADWCLVDLLSDGHAIELVAAVHRDPSLNDAIHELRRRYPPAERHGRPHAILRAMETGTTVVSEVTDEDLQARAVDDGHLALLRRLGTGSHVVAPLIARGRVMGTLSLVRTPARSPYEPDEIKTAEDIARRTALAVDNALLHRSAQQGVALRDRFLAIAAHELRTPLAVVRGHWELLERRLRAASGDAEAQQVALERSARRLGEGIDQLQRLIEELLDVNRLRAASIQLELAAVDLGQLVRDVVQGVADDERERIQLALPADPVRGRWDPARLGQVVGNLVGNALKYSPAESPVRVRLTEAGGMARLSVVDTGIGIPSDQLDAIFEPFSRAPNAVGRHFAGLGLGLAISREIVTQHGGRLWAESAGEGHGSAFTVELPLSAEG